MHRPHAPTVRQLPPLGQRGARLTTKARIRLAATAVIAGGALVAAPSIANADTLSTCSYDPTFKRVTVNDQSGGNSLRVTRGEGFSNAALMVADGDGAPRFCTGSGATATIANTDKMLINTPGSFFAQIPDNVIIDQSRGALAPGATPENDGNSEIEVQVRLTSTNGVGLTMVGTPQADTMKLGGFGSVMLGSDSDVDVSVVAQSDLSARPAQPFRAFGMEGNDFISGRGGYPAASPTPAAVKVELNGGLGADSLVDGAAPNDGLAGGSGNDALFALDGHDGDRVTGGPEFDVATLDAADTFTSDVEQNTGGVLVGRLRLAPAVLRAQAGETARMKMRWTHPKAWKALRSVEWRLMKDNKRVADITVHPASGRLSADGAAKLAAGSRVTHEGKTVTARLHVRLPEALAGEHLRVDVVAADRRGHRQLEPSAGLIHIAK
jgi:hypothetical protein